MDKLAANPAVWYDFALLKSSGFTVYESFKPLYSLWCLLCVFSRVILLGRDQRAS